MGNLSSAFSRTTAILVLAAAVIPNTRGAGWNEIDTGLPRVGVAVNSLAIDPASPSNIYAQTNSFSLGSEVPGLFKTTDGGGSWKAVGSAAGVTSLVIDPSNSSTLYAGTSQGVIKSTDAGDSWTDASNNLPAGSVVRLAIDPVTPSTLYAVTSSESITAPGGPIAMSIYKTSDSGGSWTALDTGLPPGAYITLLVIDTATPSTLYTFAPPFDPTGTGMPPVGGLLKSVDGGQSWQSLNSGLPPNIFLTSLAVDVTNSSNIYTTTSMGLFKSADGGATWNTLNGALPANTNVSLVVTDRAAPSAVYAVGTSFGPTGSSSRILESTDGGGTWISFNTGIPSNTAINFLVLDPTSPSRIYAAASGMSLGPFAAPGQGLNGGVYKSTDGGETWNSASAGLGSLDVRTLAMNPVNASTVYAGGSGGAFKSMDGGATWNSTGLSAYTGALVADSVNPDVLYAMTGNPSGCNSSDGLVLRSADGGANWSNMVSPLNSGCIINATFPAANATPMVIDPTDPNTLYLGESDDQDGYSAVLKTIDSGANWSAVWDWFNGLRGSVMALAIDPANPATVYAGIDDEQDSSGLFKSTDGGASWSNTGLTGSAVNLLAIDASNPQIVYAGTEGHKAQASGFQGLFKSTDGGATWLAVNNGLAGFTGVRTITATALIIDPANPQVLYLGTSTSGVFRSSDGGASWSSFNDGLADLQIRVLAVDSSSSHAVYAATSTGVFKYAND